MVLSLFPRCFLPVFNQQERGKFSQDSHWRELKTHFYEPQLCIKFENIGTYENDSCNNANRDEEMNVTEVERLDLDDNNTGYGSGRIGRYIQETKR